MGTSHAKQEAPPPPPPPVFEPPQMDAVSGVLAPEHLELLCRFLPQDERTHWRRIFCSSKDGKSFTRFGTQVCNRGPTLVIIRDTEGSVFGGHADESWRTYAQRLKEAQAEAAAVSRATRLGQAHDKKPERPNQHRRFFGGEGCFLFTLCPEPHVFLPSGANSNFLYYDEVSEVKEMSGVGMGGKPEFLGWFVDSWLDGGHCRGAPNCLTFDCPPLAGKESFTAEYVEVWQTSRESIAAEERDAEAASSPTKPRGMLQNEQLAADKLILQMDGRKFYSDDL
eukprot:GGOE01025274.1.p1 GENE.GGOE01025274.1~~GGOE01025274.1.p1  ORF type:complete len:281 (+),score=98.51 GGOE01025274.1:62-904(+)